MVIWKEEEANALFNETLNTFYLRLYGVRHMVKDHPDSETHYRHMGYSFRIPARALLYAPSHSESSMSAEPGSYNIVKQLMAFNQSVLFLFTGFVLYTLSS